MNELRVAYTPDDEWMGKVHVSVRSGDFAGFGEAWIGIEQIIEFAEALRQYPLPQDAPAVFEGGHFGNLDGSTPPQTLVQVIVKPKGGRGAVMVMAKLEDMIHDESRDSTLFQSVEARFLTDYNSIESFVSALNGVTQPGAAAAVLRGADWP